MTKKKPSLENPDPNWALLMSYIPSVLPHDAQSTGCVASLGPVQSTGPGGEMTESNRVKVADKWFNFVLHKVWLGLCLCDSLPFI